MVEVSGLTKTYGSKTAIQDLSFSIESGEVVGLLGPNGAGKSTTMNILTGYLAPTAGSVRIGGEDIFEHPEVVRSSIGYLPEQAPLYLDMTVEEYLSFVFDIKKTALPKKQHLESICETLAITNVAKRLVGNLSKGYRQRVGLAQALIGAPPILVLDEPTVGLDPQQVLDLRGIIRDLAQNSIIILSSHILSEVQAVCRRALIIHQGRIVADGDIEALGGSLQGRRWRARIAGPQKEVLALLQSLPGVAEVHCQGGEAPAEYILSPAERQDFREEMFYALAQRRFPLLELAPTQELEDVFVSLTQGGDG